MAQIQDVISKEYEGVATDTVSTASFSAAVINGSLIVTVSNKSAENTIIVNSIVWNGFSFTRDFSRSEVAVPRLEVWSLHGITDVGPSTVTVTWASDITSARILVHRVKGTNLPLIEVDVLQSNSLQASTLTSGTTAATQYEEGLLFAASVTNKTIAYEGHDDWNGAASMGQVSGSGDIAPTLTTGRGVSDYPQNATASVSRPVLTGGVANFICFVAIYRVSWLASVLKLGFEPPDYTVNLLNTQDDWNRLVDSTDGWHVIDNSSVLNATTDWVINETQSLAIPFTDAVGVRQIGIYGKLFRSIQDYTMSWTWHYTAAINDFEMVRMIFGGSTFDDTSSGTWHVVMGRWSGAWTGNGYQVLDGGGGIRSESIDILSPRNFSVKVSLDGSMVFSIDGVPLFSGSTKAVLVNRMVVQSIKSNAVVGDSSLILDDFTIRSTGLFGKLKTPTNVRAIRRKNYTVVFWDPTSLKADGSTLSNDVFQYDVVRSTSLNEANRVVKKQVTSTDVGGRIDTSFLDTNNIDTAVYRIRSHAVEGIDVWESELSDKAVAIKLDTQIDEKEELVDRKLFVLGKSKLGEGILG